MPKGSSALRVVMWIVRVLTALVIFAVIGFLLWRIAISGTPGELKGISVGGELADRYSENRKLTLVYQELSSITRGKTDSGYFSALEPVFIKEADQFQVILRYNNSTVRALAEDYKLPAVPDRREELYDVSLIVVTDLTPENDKDNLTEELNPESVRVDRILPDKTETVKLEKHLYNYRKLVFDGVKLDENVLAVYIDVYYVGDIKYNNDGFDVYKDRPYSTLCVYDFMSQTLERELTGEEKKALESFKDE